MIFSEFEELIRPLKEEEYSALEKSIIAEGCRDSLVMWNGFIIDGHHRYKICHENNIEFKTISLEFENKDQVKLWIINNQLARRNLSKKEFTYFLGQKYEREKQFHGNRGKTPQNEESFLTSERIAQEYAVSKGTVERAAVFAKAVDIINENVGEGTKNKILSGEIKTTKTDIKEVAKQAPNIQKRIIDYAIENDKDLRYARSKIKRKIVEENLDPQSLPQDEFEIILADPPWQYDWPITENRARERYYPTMEIDDIKELEIPSAENSILFLWSLAPKIQDALDVMKSWGFEYRTHAIWDKETIGTGFWFRGQHELLFLGIKGTIKTPESENRYSSVIRKKKTDHSRKPDIVYDMIEKMFPNRKYLELFARKQYNDKWTVWGNQL